MYENTKKINKTMYTLLQIQYQKEVNDEIQYTMFNKNINVAVNK